MKFLSGSKQTLFKFALSHKSNEDLLKSYSLRAQKVFKDALKLHFEDEAMRRTLRDSLRAVRDVLSVKKWNHSIK